VTIHVGDNYQNNGNAGAIGPNNLVTSPQMTHRQASPATADLRILAEQMSALQSRLEERAATPDRYLAARHVNHALHFIRQGDEDAASAHAAQLGKCARWVLNTATSIGASVAASWLSRYA